VFNQIGLLQIDSVNVLVRSEELPVFARLGAHDRMLVRDMERAGELFEYWGHEASLLPVATEPLLRWRMADASAGVGTWGGLARLQRDRPGFIDAVYDEVCAHGPIRAGAPSGSTPKSSQWWGWNEHKMALEFLFWCGRVSALRSASNFERLYDIRERVLPTAVLAEPTPDPTEAKRGLLMAAARHHGIGTARCLADYFRLNIREARDLLDDLVSGGRLEPVRVDDWTDDAYVHPEAVIPRVASGRRLLSPFDPLVWERTRTERLFEFVYRLEIYTPKHKRIHGYYVLPFLLDGELVARVDLKADRAASRLLVQGAFDEATADPRRVGVELHEELTDMARWLGLDDVEVARHGDLAQFVRPRRPIRGALR
jgi:uncharacterized protein